MNVELPFKDDDKATAIELNVTPEDLLNISRRLQSLANDPNLHFVRSASKWADVVHSLNPGSGSISQGIFHVGVDYDQERHSDKRLNIMMHRVANMNIDAVNSGLKPGTSVCVMAESIIEPIKAVADRSPSHRWRLNCVLSDIERSVGMDSIPMMCIATIADAVKCDTCGIAVATKCLDVHKRGWECAISAAKTSAEDNGLIEVDPSIVYEIVKATNVDIRLVPVKYAVYAPPWVKTMIEAFNNSKIEGLSLSEMLNKAASKE